MIMRYWGVKPVGLYAWIFCPCLDGSLKMCQKYEIYKEFRVLEAELILETAFVGWVGCTKLVYPKIMKWMTRVGASPFEISLLENKIWFKKDFER